MAVANFIASLTILFFWHHRRSDRLSLCVTPWSFLLFVFRLFPVPGTYYRGMCFSRVSLFVCSSVACSTWWKEYQVLGVWFLLNPRARLSCIPGIYFCVYVCFLPFLPVAVCTFPWQSPCHDCADVVRKANTFAVTIVVACHIASVIRVERASSVIGDLSRCCMLFYTWYILWYVLEVYALRFLLCPLSKRHTQSTPACTVNWK